MRVHLLEVEPETARGSFELLGVRRDRLEVRRTQRTRIHAQHRLALQADKRRGLREVELDLVAVDDLERDQVVPPVPNARQRASFAKALDQYLSRTNEDYQAHRAGGFGLRAPEIAAVAPGTFAAWMKHRGKLGGQNKVPRIINDQDLFADLRAFRANE